MNYTRKTISFIGLITSITQVKDWNINEVFYQLKIETKEVSLGTVKVYQRKVSELIWNSISQQECLNHSYLFTVEKIINTYHLKEWKLVE